MRRSRRSWTYESGQIRGCWHRDLMVPAADELAGANEGTRARWPALLAVGRPSVAAAPEQAPGSRRRSRRGGRRRRGMAGSLEKTCETENEIRERRREKAGERGNLTCVYPVRQWRSEAFQGGPAQLEEAAPGGSLRAPTGADQLAGDKPGWVRP